MAHEPTTCTKQNCEKCIGLKMYPEPTLCEFCNTMHAGNSNNCPQPEPEDYYPFPDDPPGTEQLCWNVFNAVKDTTSMVKEQMMIPESTNKGGGSNFQPRGNQRGSGGAQRQRSGLPYLNIGNQHEYLVLDDATTVRIVDCRVGGNQTGTSAVTLRLAIRGKSVLWGLSLNNPSLDVLTEMFGRNENDWINKDIAMWLEEDRMTEKVWIHCGPADATEKDVEPEETKPTRKRRG